jgi:hypothetical protein
MELNQSPNIKVQRVEEEVPDFHFEFLLAADLERSAAQRLALIGAWV